MDRLGISFGTFLILTKESIHSRKKIVKFQNFGPDPPLEVVKPQFFFLLQDQKIIMCKTRKD